MLKWRLFMRVLNIMKLRLAPLSWQIFAASAFLALMLAGTSEAATVYSCADSGERCVVRLEDGIVGDQVRILDEKARPIAAGRIVKKRGNFAVVKVTNASQVVRKGYPVIINIDSRSSSLQWAASFTNQD
jgi:hypothetical protein